MPDPNDRQKCIEDCRRLYPRGGKELRDCIADCPPPPPPPPPPGETDEEKKQRELQECIARCRQSFPPHLKDPEMADALRNCIRACRGRSPIGEEDEDKETPAGCPPESKKAKAYTGKGNCPCGSRFKVPTKDFPCPPGYRMVIGTKGPSCRCEDWCKEQLAAGKVSAACTGGGKGEEEEGEEFEWSPEIQALLQRILDRANMLLDQPLGLSEEERQAIYNRIFEKIKGAERPAIQSEEDRISRMGLLGSPFAERSIAGIRRGTGQMLAATERDIEIEEAQRRFEQLMGTTGMAQSLLGTGLGAEGMVESLSAGRRGESRDWMQMLLNYFAMIYGGQDNTYWQAILNRLLNPE